MYDPRVGAVRIALMVVGLIALAGAVYFLLFKVPVIVANRRLRRAAAGWDEVARELGSRLELAVDHMSIDAAVGGRPVRVACSAGHFSRGSTRGATWVPASTGIQTWARHPDDVHDDVPMPSRDWAIAWQEAEARSSSLEPKRPPLQARCLHVHRYDGIAEAGTVRARVRELTDAVTRAEQDVVRWRDTAREVGLTSLGAYLAEGEVRHCTVKVVLEPMSRIVMVRATGEARGARDTVTISRGAPLGGYEDHAVVAAGLPAHYVARAADTVRGQARLTDAARAAIPVAAPQDVIAEQGFASVALAGGVPDAARWRAAILLVVELVAAPGEGALR